ncbi:hypothetical protein NDU88_002713 [Pleurodeles waltl]|uniref:Uncharacterized protein n=1 Tax=Pleurodeles waltl TaxID=8319 RepID=A0AAV7UWF3_PLEWA|nr:hypothetical protein NDU88_002713 [Pleurodeles waltl]
MKAEGAEPRYDVCGQSTYLHMARDPKVRRKRQAEECLSSERLREEDDPAKEPLPETVLGKQTARNTRTPQGPPDWKATMFGEPTTGTEAGVTRQDAQSPNHVPGGMCSGKCIIGYKTGAGI